MESRSQLSALRASYRTLCRRGRALRRQCLSLIFPAECHLCGIDLPPEEQLACRDCLEELQASWETQRLQRPQQKPFPYPLLTVIPEGVMRRRVESALLRTPELLHSWAALSAWAYIRQGWTLPQWVGSEKSSFAISRSPTQLFARALARHLCRPYVVIDPKTPRPAGSLLITCLGLDQPPHLILPRHPGATDRSLRLFGGAIPIGDPSETSVCR